MRAISAVPIDAVSQRVHKRDGMTKRREIAEQLRVRILAGIDDGGLGRGDRLPSSRELAPEFGADPRVVTAAYRELAMESLVEIRPKSGVFVSSAAPKGGGTPYIPVNWVADVFVQAVNRGVPLPELGSTVFDFAETRRIRAAAVADTIDQAVGISRELKREYGVTASSHHLAEIQSPRLPPKLALARVIFAANDCAAEVHKVARALKRPMVAVSLRADLFDTEWLSLIQGEVFVVATDPAFLEKVRHVFPRAKGPANVRLMVVGRDDLSRIPKGAPTYLTESARKAIGSFRLPGRVIKPRRLFSDNTVRDIVSFIVAQNSSAA